MNEIDYEDDCKQWLIEQFKSLTDEKITITVSQWAEENRYLPKSVTEHAGFFSWTLTPFLKEIADCMSLSSPVQIIDVMKGVQIGFSQGVIENSIGYEIAHVKNSPCMLITTDAELAQTLIETRIIRMLQASELDDLIMSSDEKNKKKTGRTSKKLEWKGGGFLLPYGANSPGKVRMTSIKRLYRDEVDSYKDLVAMKKEGGIMNVSFKRTAAFEETRKILSGGTPLILQTSKIYKEFLKGDQRKYYVPCPHCKKFQVLIWQKQTADGKAYGMVFDVDEFGAVKDDTVGYACMYCEYICQEHDKRWMMNSGEWRPTAQPSEVNRRSYHISTLYSLFQSWAECSRGWCNAWNVIDHRPKDIDALRSFYNLILGEPYEEAGGSIKLEKVVTHRRPQYNSGEVPNLLALEETGSEIICLTCAVDVHKFHLDIQVIGWCKGSRFYSLDWIVAEGDAADIYDIDSPWNKVREIIENKVYVADNGKQYKVNLTLIDAGYAPSPDAVYLFCKDYSGGVYPIMGRNMPTKNANFKQFSPFVSKLGTPAFNVTVTIYKDRLSSALNGEWSGQGFQPINHPNFPQDYPESFFKQLTVEYKAEKINEKTGERLGFEWHRPNNAPNHSWDLTVYCWAAFDMLVLMKCEELFNLAYIDYNAFFKAAEEMNLFPDP